MSAPVEFVFGHVEGTHEGQIFKSRKDLSDSGIHAPPMHGIWGRQNRDPAQSFLRTDTKMTSMSWITFSTPAKAARIVRVESRSLISNSHEATRAWCLVANTACRSESLEEPKLNSAPRRATGTTVCTT